MLHTLTLPELQRYKSELVKQYEGKEKPYKEYWEKLLTINLLISELKQVK